jgi:hypothetical protein
MVVLPSLVLAAALAATATVTATSTEPDDTALSPFERSLDRLPASALDDDHGVLYYVDLELAWERAGIAADADERDRISAMIELPTWTQHAQLFGQRFSEVDDARAEVGFTMFDIDREITVQSPPNNITIAETRVDPEAVITAVESDPMWSPELTVVEHPDGGYFQWGDDPTAHELTRMSPMRPFGQGGQLALIGDDTEATVVRTVAAGDMEAVLSTIGGRGDSLLDVDMIAAAVDALGNGDVIQVTAMAGAIGFDAVSQTMSPEQIEAMLADMVLLQPYDGVVIAELYDGSESQTKVLLLHGSDDAAAANAELVEQALAEGVDPITREPLADLLPGAEVAAGGPVVAVTLPFEGAYPQAQRMLMQRSLFPTG